MVTPCVGVWIETKIYLACSQAASWSHPAWVCGLKQNFFITYFPKYGHTLRGCVDWNLDYQTLTNKFNSHTLRGCVDWNTTRFYLPFISDVTPCVGVWIETRAKRLIILFRCHTLRGCVDWNYNNGVGSWCNYGHTLRGCVDWNTTRFYLPFISDVTPCVGVWIETNIIVHPPHCALCHTLRGCVDWNTTNN